jgi:acetylornithine deacetylase/succinyl-diaminopimelate desuccinylase-like protein
VALVADSPFHAPGWPTVELGVRGLCYVEITVRTLTRDVHSGLYGGVAPNAHHALVRILAGLSDRAGRLRLPGINRAVRRPTAAERDAWAALPFDEAAFTHDEVGATALVGDARRSVLERLWARPSLDIHGITGGFSGKGVKTVIPAEARAKVSLRLVPDQQPAQVLALLAHRVGELAPDWATVSVRPLILTEPVLVDIAGPWLAPLDAAFHEAFGHGLSLVRSGGSLPILGALGSGGATVLMAGIGLPDDGLHSPNERIAIPQFLNGIRAFASYFRRLGHLHTGVRS